ncbi:hypothetical protein IWQ60_002104 [Tieghemiomyces parasiticus]|uniref:SCP domain-containing protein n=1 Tax=Tieghemiomyces parasiticus TaxID=78921 RepID=A0A9W8AFF8_9FUNG|nr:hypothetical protein IWQ60_002104 [Tieghemiomyces parasiticus]
MKLLFCLSVLGLAVAGSTAKPADSLGAREIGWPSIDGMNFGIPSTQRLQSHRGGQDESGFSNQLGGQDEGGFSNHRGGQDEGGFSDHRGGQDEGGFSNHRGNQGESSLANHHGGQNDGSQSNQRGKDQGNGGGAVDQSKMLDLVNTQRGQSGLSTLQYSSDLEQAAQSQCQYQSNSQTMTHSNPEGDVGKRLSNLGVRWSYVAENVAEGQKNEDDVMNSWMNSPGHRANILSAKSTHTATYRVGKYWTQVFAAL